MVPARRLGVAALGRDDQVVVTVAGVVSEFVRCLTGLGADGVQQQVGRPPGMRCPIRPLVPL